MYSPNNSYKFTHLKKYTYTQKRERLHLVFFLFYFFLLFFRNLCSSACFYLLRISLYLPWYTLDRFETALKVNSSSNSYEYLWSIDILKRVSNFNFCSKGVLIVPTPSEEKPCPQHLNMNSL